MRVYLDVRSSHRKLTREYMIEVKPVTRVGNFAIKDPV